MPIYDYVCAACRHRIEVIHGINDPGPRFCPSCGAEGTLHKAPTSPAVHFKGSGWAKKDRSSSSSTKTRSGSGSSSSDNGSQDGASGSGGSDDGTKAPPAKSDGGTESKGSTDSKGSTGSTARTED